MKGERITFQLQPNNSLVCNLYNLPEVSLDRNGMDSETINELAINYGNQLLIPLFQETMPYSQINQVKNSPRFTPQEANREIQEYLSRRENLGDRIFLLLAEDNNMKPFSTLLGYASGFGIKREELESFFKEKFIPGATGTSNEDELESKMTINQLASVDSKFIYFNGLGVARNYQGLGLGLYLAREFFRKAAGLGYNWCITRVIRGAKNWSIFGGNQDKSQQPIPGTRLVASYYNSLFDQEQSYRAIFLNDISRAFTFFDDLYAKKGKSI